MRPALTRVSSPTLASEPEDHSVRDVQSLRHDRNQQGMFSGKWDWLIPQLVQGTESFVTIEIQSDFIQETISLRLRLIISNEFDL